MTPAGGATPSAEIEAQAESLSPTSTRVRRDHRPAHHRARWPSSAAGIIGDVSKKLMAQFAGNLNTMLDEQHPPADTADDHGAAPARR